VYLVEADDLKQRDLTELLANLPELSNAQVDVLLIELLSEVEEADVVPMNATPQSAPSEPPVDVAPPQPNLEELLANLDQLSDQTVDSLIADLLAEENKKYVE
jgi:hypothetical protein